jgi:hypothetical protein
LSGLPSQAKTKLANDCLSVRIKRATKGVKTDRIRLENRGSINSLHGSGPFSAENRVSNRYSGAATSTIESFKLR